MTKREYLEEDYYKPLLKKVFKAFSERTLTSPEIVRLLEYIERKLLEKRKYKKEYYLDWKVKPIDNVGLTNIELEAFKKFKEKMI